MTLPEWMDFGKWTPFIWWCYVVTAVVLISIGILSYRKEHRLLRNIAQQKRREHRGAS
ncbi:MAG: heme exporter protein CcmD [Gammaproteobacteria bacterium]|nr:heme exporter protein CcmD [Gammaproteobacteria bacterium]